MQEATLSEANLEGADLSRSKPKPFSKTPSLTQRSEKDCAPIYEGIRCPPIGTPTLCKLQAVGQGAMRSFLRKRFKAFLPWGDDDPQDSDEDGADDESHDDSNDGVAEKMGQKLDPAVNKAEVQLKGSLKKVDVAMKPQV